MAGLLDKASESSDSGLLSKVEEQKYSGESESASVSIFDGDAELGFSFAKWGAVGVTSLLVLFIFYQMSLGFNLGGYSFTFTEADIDEEDNNLRLKLSVGTPMFGGVSDDPVILSISYDGAEVWNGTETIDSKANWFEIPLSDFYQGNVRDGTGFNNHNNYVVTAEQGETTTDYTITPDSLLDRTLTNASGEVRTISENGDCPNSDSAGTNGKCHVGAQFTLKLGRDDPVNTGSMWHVNSDYTISVSVEYNSDGTGTFTSVFEYPQITVDGWLATWGGKAGVESGGTAIEDSMMYMGGGKTDTFTKMPYLERGYFFDDDKESDGCYRMSITVEHSAGFGDSFTDFSDGTLLSWQYNEDPNRGGDYKPDESC